MMERNVVQQNESSRGLSGVALGGVSLVLLGVVFTAVNLLGIGRLENWWSGFILLPGILFLGLGRTMWSGNGRVAFLPRFNTGLGLILVTVALMFLFGLNWEVWWPMMIVMPGVAAWMLGGVRSGVGGTAPSACPTKLGRSGQAVLRLGRWLGFTMILLGLTFLADQLSLINLQAAFGDFHWWGFFILIPGIGAFVEGLRVMRQSTWASMSLLIAGVWIVSSGLMEIFAPNWQSWEGMVGIGLIGTGLLSRGWLFIHPDADSD
jgi:hypothetical protein